MVLDTIPNISPLGGLYYGRNWFLECFFRFKERGFVFGGYKRGIFYRIRESFTLRFSEMFRPLPSPTKSLENDELLGIPPPPSAKTLVRALPYGTLGGNTQTYSSFQSGQGHSQMGGPGGLPPSPLSVLPQ